MRLILHYVSHRHLEDELTVCCGMMQFHQIVLTKPFAAMFTYINEVETVHENMKMKLCTYTLGDTKFIRCCFALCLLGSFNNQVCKTRNK